MGAWFKKSENTEQKNRQGHIWIIVIGAALGMGLLLFGSHERSASTAAEELQTTNSTEETIIYRKRLEEEIRTLCESVSGVGEVRVAVTLDGGFREVYATEGNDSEYVIVGSGSSATPILISRDPPPLVGIGIVCRGGSSPSVQRELVALLSAAFDLPSNRIYVTEAK